MPTTTTLRVTATTTTTTTTLLLNATRRYQTNIAANRFGAGVGVWFVGNMLSNQLISTGAFEVYYDGRLVSGLGGSGGDGGGGGAVGCLLLVRLSRIGFCRWSASGLNQHVWGLSGRQECRFQDVPGLLDWEQPRKLQMARLALG